MSISNKNYHLICIFEENLNNIQSLLLAFKEKYALDKDYFDKHLVSDQNGFCYFHETNSQGIKLRFEISTESRCEKILFLKPALIILNGVAFGNPENTKEGDVLFSTRICKFDSEEGTNTYEISHDLCFLSQQIEEKKDYDVIKGTLLFSSIKLPSTSIDWKSVEKENAIKNLYAISNFSLDLKKKPTFPLICVQGIKMNSETVFKLGASPIKNSIDFIFEFIDCFVKFSLK